MGQLAFDFINNFLNMIFTSFITPLMTVLYYVMPGFSEIVTNINSFFNIYVWQYVRFIVSVLNYGLKCPQYVWTISISLIVFSLNVYIPLKSVKLIYNLWCVYRGSKSSSLVKK